MPYDWTILLEYAGTAEEIYDLEVSFKTEMEQYHYTPLIPFHGSISECYIEISENLQKLTTHSS